MQISKEPPVQRIEVKVHHENTGLAWIALAIVIAAVLFSGN